MVRRLFISFQVVFLLFIATPHLSAAEPANPLSFAGSLYEEGDYYRAITEYKRFLHSSPSHPLAPRAALAIARSYLAGERWQEAESALDRLRELFPRAPESEQTLLLSGDIAFKQKKYSQAEARYLQASKAAGRGGIRREAERRAAWALIEQDRYEEAGQLLARLKESHAANLAGELKTLDSVELKSPRLAGILSAALPGSGQLYAGRPREAGLSLALNAAFILGAIESFENNQNMLGGILLFFEFGWYTGNIFNAVNSAHKYNRDLREAYKSDLRKKFRPNFGIAEDGSLMPGLQMTF